MKLKIIFAFLLTSSFIKNSLSSENSTKFECGSSKSEIKNENFPSKILHQSLTVECKKSMEIYEEGLKNLEIWALESNKKYIKIQGLNTLPIAKIHFTKIRQNFHFSVRFIVKTFNIDFEWKFAKFW